MSFLHYMLLTCCVPTDRSGRRASEERILSCIHMRENTERNVFLLGWGCQAQFCIQLSMYCMYSMGMQIWAILLIMVPLWTLAWSSGQSATSRNHSFLANDICCLPLFPNSNQFNCHFNVTAQAPNKRNVSSSLRNLAMNCRPSICSHLECVWNDDK